MSTFFTRTEIEIPIQYDAADETMRFYLRPVLAKEHKMMVQKHYALTETEKQKRQHLHNVELLTSLITREPENLPLFNPSERNLENYFSSTTVGEVQQVKSELNGHAESLSDEQLLKLIDDKKAKIVEDVLNEYYDRITKKFF